MDSIYNRYIPQSDGTYRKNCIPEQHQNKRPPHPVCPPPKPAPPEPPCPAGGFLKNLIPQDFDTADLLVVLLLLLMSGSCEEDRNTALLTLALYFFL